MEIITTKVIFKGLYTWGEGWNEETRVKWDEFWDSKDANGLFWGSFKREKGHGTERHLVAIGGSAYLHPMNFSVTLSNLCKSSHLENGVWVEDYPEIDELKDILEKCCAYVGGSFEIEPVKKHTIQA